MSRPSFHHWWLMACSSPAGAYTAVYAVRPPQLATEDAGIGLDTGSSGSRLVTPRATVARATKSGAGGTAARPNHTATMATTASATARLYAWRHVRAPRSRNTGVMARSESAAAPSRAKMGLMRTRGKATLRAAKIEKPSRIWLSQGRGCTIAVYQGSMAVTSAPATTPAKKITLTESRVALAQ